MINGPFVLTSLSFALLIGALPLFLGSRLAKYSKYLSVGALFLFCISLTLGLFQHRTAGFVDQLWSVEWLPEFGKTFAVNFGFYLGSQNMWICLTVCLGYLFTCLVPKTSEDRFTPFLPMSFLGVMIAWIGTNPWTTLSGWTINLVVCFALLCKNDQKKAPENEGKYSFLLMQMACLFFAVLGFSIGFSHGNVIDYTMSPTWVPFGEVILGLWIVAGAILLSLGGFPTFLSSNRQERNPSSFVVFELANFLCVSGMVFNLIDHFNFYGISLLMGDLAIFLILVTSVLSINSTSPSLLVSRLATLLFLFVVVLATQVGDWAVGRVLLGGIPALFAASWLLVKHDVEKPKKPKVDFLQNTGIAIIFLGLLSFPGFFGVGAIVEWMGSNGDVGGRTFFSALVLFFISLTAWKFYLSLIDPEFLSSSKWLVRLSVLFSLVGLGFWWTGDFLGFRTSGMRPADLFGFSGISLKSLSLSYRPTNEFWITCMIFMASPFVAVLFRKNWKALAKKSFGYRFFGDGLTVEKFYRRGLNSLSETALLVERFVVGGLWNRSIPGFLVFASNFISQKSRSIDIWISESVTRVLRLSGNVSGKVMQIVQGGNPQAYLYFTALGVLMILVYFRIRADW